MSYDSNLESDIGSVLDRCCDVFVRDEFEQRLGQGGLTRDENERSHCCVYFVPFNRQMGELLIGDHKKSGLWLMPGGHIDKRESLLCALNREINEELGVADFFSRSDPFLLTVTDIVGGNITCKKHFDVWHLMDTDGSDFEVDYSEYHEVRWVSIEKARNMIIDPASLRALAVLEGVAMLG